MAVLAQCGFGRSDRIEKGIGAESISGVILSPRDELPGRLESFVQELRNDVEDAVITFDPQFYAATLRNPRDGNLPEYGYYADNCGLGRNQFGARHIQRYVKACLDYQHDNLQGLSYLTSPTIVFDDFRDFWSQVALNLAEESIEYHSQIRRAPPLLISVATSESALKNMDGLNEFLDALSSLEVEGFYLLVQRNGSSMQPAMDATAMENLLYMTYVLGSVNGYEVTVGYSDWLGMLLEAAGAKYTACGWYQNLRQFSMARFNAATGGRRPRKRYSSAPLMSSILIQPEMEDIYLARALPSILTGTDYDRILRNGPFAGENNWTDEISCLAHWAALAALSRRFDGENRVTRRLGIAENMIRASTALYASLEGRGVVFEAPSGPAFLDIWQESLTGFRAIAGL